MDPKHPQPTTERFLAARRKAIDSMRTTESAAFTATTTAFGTARIDQGGENTAPATTKATIEGDEASREAAPATVPCTRGLVSLIVETIRELEKRTWRLEDRNRELGSQVKFLRECMLENAELYNVGNKDVTELGEAVSFEGKVEDKDATGGASASILDPTQLRGAKMPTLETDLARFLRRVGVRDAELQAVTLDLGKMSGRR